jgi:general secretion pathway protein A
VSLDDLARAPEPPSRETLTATFRSFVTSLRSLQASAVLVIDEAQNVPVHVLAELPSLMHDDQPVRALELILVGQPGIAKLLKRRELRELNAQIVVRAHLGPLTPEELGGYVMHRVGVVSGSRSRVDFDETALERINALAEGLPRTVNLLCDRALTRGFESGAGVIDATLVEAAGLDLELVRPAGRYGALRAALASAAFLALMLVGAATALFVFHDTAARTITVWERVPQSPAGPLKLVPPSLPPIDPPAE